MDVYPVADAACLRKVFNEKLDSSDSMMMFPFDMSTTPYLLDRFDKGRLVSFCYKSGKISAANDCDPVNLWASMYFVKDVSYVPFGDLSKSDVVMLERVNNGFMLKWESNEICIDPKATVTLIRFNLANSLRFIPTGNVQLRKVVH